MKAKLELNENKDAGKSVEEDIILLCDNIIDQLTPADGRQADIELYLQESLLGCILHCSA